MILFVWETTVTLRHSLLQSVSHLLARILYRRVLLATVQTVQTVKACVVAKTSELSNRVARVKLLQIHSDILDVLNFGR